MAIAKIITEGNTQKIILPEGCRFFDCDEAEVEMIGTEIRLAPKSDETKGSFFETIKKLKESQTEPEEYRYASDEEVKKMSEHLMEKNLEAYKELAK